MKTTNSELTRQNPNEINGYRLLFGYLGIFIGLIGIINLIPLIVIPFRPNDNLIFLPHFLITGLSCVAVGMVLYFTLLFKKKLGKLRKKQDSILILLIWVLSIMISAIPLSVSKIEGMNYAKALFEMVSGFTTTGVTTIANVETFPKIFLVQHVISQLFGGVGLVLIIASAFSGIGGMKLYNAEGHSEALLPNLAKSAQVIVTLYLVYIALGTGAFMLAGMSFFQAISYSIACISTGGFSVTNGGIHGFNSLSIEIIAMVLMMFGATNFFVHLFLLTGKFKHAFFDTETIIFFIVVFLTPLICSLLLTPQIATTYFNTGEQNLLGATITNYGEALRYTSFQLVSALTTTGLQSVGTLKALPEAIIVVICFFMFVGGSSGSTAGGIKIFRFHVIIKGIYYSIVDGLGNKRVIRTHFVRRHGEENELDKETVIRAVGYALIYFAVIAIGMFLFTIAHPTSPFGDAFFEAASLTGGVGFNILLNSTSGSLSLWTSILLMFLGRLEILVVFKALAQSGEDAVRGFHHLHDRRKEKIRLQKADDNQKVE